MTFLTPPAELAEIASALNRIAASLVEINNMLADIAADFRSVVYQDENDDFYFRTRRPK